MTDIYNDSLYIELSNYLTERTYDVSREKKSRNLVKKYRLKFVDSLSRNAEQLKHGERRAGMLLELSRLYKKYNGRIPVNVKNDFRRNWKLRGFPSAEQTYNYANNQKDHWKDFFDRQTQANQRRAEETKSIRRAYMIFYSLVLVTSIMRTIIIINRQKKKNRARRKK